MKIAIGCDPNAKAMKDDIAQYCRELGYAVEDLGGDDAIYANTAKRVADYVVAGNAARGILLCGTGIGMTIAANKVKGAYAAPLADAYSAERAVKSNNANIGCIGAFTIGSQLARLLVKTYLACEYDPNTPSAPKVEGIKAVEAAQS